MKGLEVYDDEFSNILNNENKIGLSCNHVAWSPKDQGCWIIYRVSLRSLDNLTYSNQIFMSYKPVALTYDDQNFRFYRMITFYVIMQNVNVA